MDTAFALHVSLAVLTLTVTLVKIDTHIAYTAQQWLDSYNKAIQHATNHKAAFNRRVVKKGGIVTFEKGQLVQAY